MLCKLQTSLKDSPKRGLHVTEKIHSMEKTGRQEERGGRGVGQYQTPIGPRAGGTYQLSPLPAPEPEPPGLRGFYLSLDIAPATTSLLEMVPNKQHSLLDSPSSE